MSEKVSHHPPVLAFHCESISSASGSPSEPPQWQLYGHVAPNQKFWGRSMEIFVQGDISVRFPASDPEGTTVYSIRKPSSFVKNLVAGTKYIEVVGDLVVAVSNSPAHAVVAFKEGSSWGGVSTRNKIEGRVVDERGASRIELVGRWDDAVDKKEGKSTFTRLWQMADSPPSESESESSPFPPSLLSALTTDPPSPPARPGTVLRLLVLYHDPERDHPPRSGPPRPDRLAPAAGPARARVRRR